MQAEPLKTTLRLTPFEFPRSRLRVCVALAATIALGLATRVDALPWPEFVAANFGDALWTVAAYLGLCLVFPQLNPAKVAILAACISIVVEFSQMSTLPWLTSLRETLPGRLLLGTGFLWIDIPRYLSGAFIAFLIECYWQPLTAEPDA
ncbi:MAG: DUF2809 domain-containing protein [Pseudomonadales bacterium]